MTAAIERAHLTGRAAGLPADVYLFGTCIIDLFMPFVPIRAAGGPSGAALRRVALFVR